MTASVLKQQEYTPDICTPITQCRMCGSDKIHQVLDLGVMALTGVFPTENAAQTPRGPMQLCKCDVCQLVQLSHNYNPTQLYGKTYGYRSGLNASMVKHLQNTFTRLQTFVPLAANDWVIDIGANDGTGLGSYNTAGLNRLGIDPSAEKFRKYYQDGIQLLVDFFTEDNAKKVMGNAKAKIITSISMFYDLPAPLQFAKDVYSMLDDNGIWMLEQSYLPFMLQTRSYDTICQEHLEYYALHQITYLCEQVGFKIIDLQFNDINGGSFALVLAKKSNVNLVECTNKIHDVLAEERAIGLHTNTPWEKFNTVMETQRQELQALLADLKKQGKTVFGLGASTKGNVLIQYCGLTAADIPYIAEVNPDKFGAYTPGSAIPIISETQARAMNPDYFLVLPWHFRDNIVAREHEFLAKGGKLIFPMPKLEIVSA